MIGFAKFQDDLHIIRAGLECAPSSSTNAAACAALIRVCEFAKTLESLDLHEPDTQGAPPCDAVARTQTGVCPSCGYAPVIALPAPPEPPGRPAQAARDAMTQAAQQTYPCARCGEGTVYRENYLCHACSND